jgi:hypothetical protein
MLRWQRATYASKSRETRGRDLHTRDRNRHYTWSYIMLLDVKFEDWEQLGHWKRVRRVMIGECRVAYITEVQSGTGRLLHYVVMWRDKTVLRSVTHDTFEQAEAYLAQKLGVHPAQPVPSYDELQEQNARLVAQVNTLVHQLGRFQEDEPRAEIARLNRLLNDYHAADNFNTQSNEQDAYRRGVEDGRNER